MAKRGRKKNSEKQNLGNQNNQVLNSEETTIDEREVLNTAEKKSRKKVIVDVEPTEVGAQGPDEDEKDIINKMSSKDKDDENTEVVREVVQDSEGTSSKDFSNLGWWLAIPRRDRFSPGDIVYHVDMDRFGIFVQPSRKEGLVKMRLFKLGSKTDVYTRDWYFPFEVLTLVKHSNTVKRGFVETDVEFVKRAGKNPKVADASA